MCEDPFQTPAVGSKLCACALHAASADSCFLVDGV
jgi:hypothetical protein